jgi:hypothetical protein
MEESEKVAGKAQHPGKDQCAEDALSTVSFPPRIGTTLA